METTQEENYTLPDALDMREKALNNNVVFKELMKIINEATYKGEVRAYIHDDLYDKLNEDDNYYIINEFKSKRYYIGMVNGSQYIHW